MLFSSALENALFMTHRGRGGVLGERKRRLRRAVPGRGRHGPAPLLGPGPKTRPSGGPERVPGAPAQPGSPGGAGAGSARAGAPPGSLTEKPAPWGTRTRPGRPGPARVARRCRCWVGTGRRPSGAPVRPTRPLGGPDASRAAPGGPGRPRATPGHPGPARVANGPRKHGTFATRGRTFARVL